MIGVCYVERQMSLLEEVPASHSPSQGNAKDSRGSLDSCSNIFEQYARFVLAGLFGKTSRERSRSNVGRLSDSSCPRWTNSGMAWRGAYLTRNSSVWHNDANVCMLSDILETCVPEKYSLSQRACAGIIRRASKRGKPLPKPLRDALEKVANRGLQ